MIKIGCHTLPWANFYKDKPYDIKKVLTDIKKIGYDGVELVEPISSMGDAESFKKYMHTLGLELASLSCSLDEKLKHRIDFLKHFDTDVAMLCTGWIAKRERREGILIQGLREDLEPIADYAEKQDIRIAFHPHKDTLIETEEDLEDFYSEPTSVKLCLDIAHLAACGSNPFDVLKKFREKVVYIHLKDYDYRRKDFTELGWGDLDLKLIVSYLKDNYTGWLTVELDHSLMDPIKSAATSREYLRKLGL